MKAGLRPFDYGAILLAVTAAILSTVLVYGRTGPDLRILIQGAGGRWIFPGDAAETVVVPGPLGNTVVELRDGEARILASPCVNQTCVSAGKIHAPGQWLVCLPNRVFVSAAGGEAAASGEEGLDALAW